MGLGIVGAARDLGAFAARWEALARERRDLPFSEWNGKVVVYLAALTGEGERFLAFEREIKQIELATQVVFAGQVQALTEEWQGLKKRSEDALLALFQRDALGAERLLQQQHAPEERRRLFEEMDRLDALEGILKRGLIPLSTRDRDVIPVWPGTLHLALMQVREMRAQIYRLLSPLFRVQSPVLVGRFLKECGQQITSGVQDAQFKERLGSEMRDIFGAEFVRAVDVRVGRCAREGVEWGGEHRFDDIERLKQAIREALVLGFQQFLETGQSFLEALKGMRWPITAKQPLLLSLFYEEVARCVEQTKEEVQGNFPAYEGPALEVLDRMEEAYMHHTPEGRQIRCLEERAGTTRSQIEELERRQVGAVSAEFLTCLQGWELVEKPDSQETP